MSRLARCAKLLAATVLAWTVSVVPAFGLQLFGLVECPGCYYKFDGPVPPPMIPGLATGSGFVVHPDGYILTNYHVIEGAHSIKVKVAGQDYTASVVESLPAQDLALFEDRRPRVACGRAGKPRPSSVR